MALLLSLSALYVPAGDLEIYSDYNSLLKMEKPELRVSKLLDMLDKYPEMKIVANAKTVPMLKGYYGVDEDRVLVMKDGDVVEQGSHKELLERNGFYATIYNSQFE